MILLIFKKKKKQLNLHHHFLQLLILKIIETTINALFIAVEYNSRRTRGAGLY